MLTRLALLCSCTFIFSEQAGLAQQSWEFSAYRVHLWHRVSPETVLPARFEHHFSEELARRSERVMGAVWQFASTAPPEDLAGDLDADLRRLTVDAIERADPEVFRNDKLFLLSINADWDGYSIHVRELDCRTETFGPVISRKTPWIQRIADEAFSAVTAAFAAVVRIEGGEGRALTVRVRSGGLITDSQSPAAVDVGDILQPVIRRNDRLGRLVASGSGVVDWTFLQVLGQQQANPSLLDVYVHSGLRSPIRARSGSSWEQYALAVRPTFGATELRVDAQVAKDEPPYSLEGLEVYRRSTPAAAAVSEKPGSGDRSEFLGYTDWRGAIRIEPSESPLTVVYLKNGGRLLARLPIVSGLSDSLRLTVPDDDPRLQAEGTVQGFHNELVDLIAQQRILSAAINNLEADQKQESQQLMSRFSQLSSRSDMQRMLDQHRRRQRRSDNRMVQGRIDQLYGEARRALGKFLDPNLGSDLLRKLRQAER